MLTLIKRVFKRRHATSEQLAATLVETSEQVEPTPPETQLAHAVAQISLELHRNACNIALSTPDIIFLLAEVLPLADLACLALSSWFFFDILGSRLSLLNLPENAGQRVSFLTRFQWHDTNPPKILCVVCAQYHSWEENSYRYPSQGIHLSLCGREDPVAEVIISPRFTVSSTCIQLMKRYLANYTIPRGHAHARRYGLDPVEVHTVFVERNMRHRLDVSLTPSGEAALRIDSVWDIFEVDRQLDFADTVQADELPSLMCSCLNLELMETIKDGCTRAFAQIKACELQNESCYGLARSTVTIPGWYLNSKVDGGVRVHGTRYINWLAASCPICRIHIGVILAHTSHDHWHEMSIFRYYGLGPVKSHSVPWRLRI